MPRNMRAASVAGLSFGSAAIVLLLFTYTRALHPAQPINDGKYFVEAVAICFECHSERDYANAGWPIPAGKAGDGRILWGEGTKDQLVAPNITPDKETGIGTWSDVEIIRAIRDGVAPDGHRLSPEMPYMYFRSLSDGNLKSIVSYLRSIPPVFHQLPKNSPRVEQEPARAILMDSLSLSRSDAKVLRGEFLVRIAGCETCHTPIRSGTFIKGLEFGGGTVFRHGKEMAASSNLTSHESGISYYDEHQFIEAMRTGKVGARRLMSAMPWLFYRNMATEDLKSIFAYLRAVPPVHHKVDNTEPPTPCRLCGNQHGLGNRN